MRAPPKYDVMQTHYRHPQPVKSAWEFGTKWGTRIGAAILALGAFAVATSALPALASIPILMESAVAAGGLSSAIGVAANVTAGAVGGYVAGGLTLAVPTKLLSIIPPINEAMKSPVKVRHHRVDFTVHEKDPINHRAIDREKFYTRQGKDLPANFRSRIRAEQEAARKAANPVFGSRGGV